MSRKLWVVAVGLGVLLIVLGTLWIIYSVTDTGHYDASRGAYVSNSAWPILGFFVSLAGGTLITVGSLGWMFSWFSGGDDDSDLRTSPSETLAHAVPKTRVGWGRDPSETASRTR
jgi:hypothetical protein